MSKLWVFGDSYSIPLNFVSDPEGIKSGIDKDVYTTNWINEVAKSLSVSELEAHSQLGVSNEWIFKQTFEQAQNFKTNDCVIIQLTNCDRHWFFEDSPSECNLAAMYNHPNWESDKKAAIKSYLTNLQSDNMDNIIYSSFIYSFMYIKSSMPNVKILLLPGWGAGPDTFGNLTNNISNAEFDCAETQQLFYDNVGQDSRLNHMSINNHHVLADKVSNYFNYQTPIDLTTGFTAAIYTKENI